MPDVNSPPKRTLRAERAEATRRRIADAARSLFASRGYGATTLVEIASVAGVAVQTVYAVYKSKANILRALQEGVVHQPEAGDLFARALESSDPGQAIDLFAASIRQRWELGREVVLASQDAARTDPDVRAEVERVMETRRGGIGRIAARLDGRLAAGLDVRLATAILDALTLPEVYAELVGVHGWTPDEFERWLAASLRAQLLPAAQDGARSSERRR